MTANPNSHVPMVRERPSAYSNRHTWRFAAAWWVVIALALVTWPIDASAQCIYSWRPMDGIPGVSNDVEAIVEWDPDGAGPRTPLLVAAGEFSQAGSHNAENVAAFDPATHTWSALGELGGNSTARVRALLADSSGGLVAAGSFTASFGSPVLRVARWNGTAWVQMGAGFNGPVNVLASLPNGDIIAGGTFTQSGTSTVNRIARWDGVAWRPLGTGVSGSENPEVYTLAVRGPNDLTVGGRFTTAGGTAVENLARWNGQAWTSIAQFNSSIAFRISDILYLPNGHLIVAGNFAIVNALGTTSRWIARWDGASWWPLGSGVNNSVHSLALLPDDSLLVTGSFTTVGGAPVSNVARWDGATWSAFGSTFPITSTGTSATICASDGTIYFGTSFGFFELSGTSWIAPGVGFSRDVVVLTPTLDGGVLAGGSFVYAGDVHARGIAKWNGSHWQAVGVGFLGYVSAIVEAPNGDVLAAGEIRINGGTLAHRVVRWNGSDWNELGPAMNEDINSIALMPNGDVVAGGDFNMIGSAPISHVARWNGAAWTPVGTSQAEPAESLAITPNGDIFIAARQQAIGIFRCRGADWERVDGILRPTSGSWDPKKLILLPDGRVAASVFYSSSGVNTGRVAVFDGSDWSILGGAFTVTESLFPIDTIGSMPDSRIVAMGAFSGIGSTPTRRLALWNGTTWTQLSPNIYGYAKAIAGLATNDIAIGGVISVFAHSHVSSSLAMLQCRCVADMDDDGNFANGGIPDGAVTIDDLLFFLAAFERGDLFADIDDGSGNGFYDEGVTIDDLLFFLVKFEAGC